MLTNVRCACGRMLDATGAGPGEEVGCDACGSAVRVPGLPPGVGIPGLRRTAPVFDVAVPDVTEESAPRAQRLNEGWDSGAGEVNGIDEEPDFVSAEPLILPSRPGRGAAAANPAATRVEWGRYYRSYPAAFGFGVATVALGLAGGVVKHPALGALAVVGVWALVMDVARVRRKFRVGDVCPAVVVSQRPPVVAVRADLAAAGATPRPAVKVVAQPLRWLLGGAPAVGTRLAAVAEYVAPARGGGWRNFDPEILRCATADEVEVGRVTWSIAEQEWRALEGDLAKCPSPARPGLYTLWDENRLGRRRTRWRWVGAVPAVVALGVAIALLAWYMQGHEPAVLPPGTVPGRVHTDWGR